VSLSSECSAKGVGSFPAFGGGKQAEVVQPEPTAFIASPTTFQRNYNAKQISNLSGPGVCPSFFLHLKKKAIWLVVEVPSNWSTAFIFLSPAILDVSHHNYYYYFPLVEDRLALTYYYSPRRLGFSHQTRANAEIQCRKETSESNNWVYDQKLDTTKLLPHTPSVS